MGFCFLFFLKVHISAFGTPVLAVQSIRARAAPHGLHINFGPNEQLAASGGRKDGGTVAINLL